MEALLQVAWTSSTGQKPIFSTRFFSLKENLTNFFLETDYSGFHSGVMKVAAAQFGHLFGNRFKSLDRLGESGTHNSNELNTLLFPTTTAVAVRLSVFTHFASRSTWQQGPLWLYYVPSSPFHTISICSFTLPFFLHSVHLYLIYSIHLSVVDFCFPSRNRKWGCAAEFEPPLYWCAPKICVVCLVHTTV